MIGFLYGVDRSQACRCVGQYLPVLQVASGKQISLPKRKIESVEEFLFLFPQVKEVWIDGTEQPIQRPKDDKRQKENYSGKKKRDTKKNIVATDEKKHDKRVLEDDGLIDALPERGKCCSDKEFQGLERGRDHLLIMYPRRSPMEES